MTAPTLDVHLPDVDDDTTRYTPSTLIPGPLADLIDGPDDTEHVAPNREDRRADGERNGRGHLIAGAGIATIITGLALSSFVALPVAFAAAGGAALLAAGIAASRRNRNKPRTRPGASRSRSAGTTPGAGRAAGGGRTGGSRRAKGALSRALSGGAKNANSGGKTSHKAAKVGGRRNSGRGVGLLGRHGSAGTTKRGNTGRGLLGRNTGNKTRKTSSRPGAAGASRVRRSPLTRAAARAAAARRAARRTTAPITAAAARARRNTRRAIAASRTTIRRARNTTRRVHNGMRTAAAAARARRHTMAAIRDRMARQYRNLRSRLRRAGFRTTLTAGSRTVLALLIALPALLWGGITTWRNTKPGKHRAEAQQAGTHQTTNTGPTGDTHDSYPPPPRAAISPTSNDIIVPTEIIPAPPRAESVPPPRPPKEAHMSRSHPNTDAVMEAFREFIGGYQMISVPDQDDFFGSLGEMFRVMGDEVTAMAGGLSDTPTDQAVAEYLGDVSSALTNMGDVGDEVYTTWRTANAADIERHENPRPNEQLADVGIA